MVFKPNFFENPNRTVRILYEELDVSKQISQELLSYISPEHDQPIVVVCIGTDRSTGDSLGPLVGTLLEEKSTPNFHIYGTLEDPIHAVNLEEKLREIKLKHVNPFIIGIDACLGRLKSVGFIQIGSGPIKPGAGVNKELPAVGNMHITGIVNVSGFMEFFVLQNTRLSLVLKMAKAIADGIFTASLISQRKTSLPHLNWSFEQEQTP
ncbi:spore protease YyaC [Peribacillus deserti]|uniref:Spore protease YyaC n=1 Tax=Peribacillus deserti TaxID=673318 RepID=A0A2N5M5A1_9BACI|nr:spore protease YyaC [Peribacillus deserti]PLT29512.1 spore protease YyaC [Peribacillus deserti]